MLWGITARILETENKKAGARRLHQLKNIGSGVRH